MYKKRDSYIPERGDIIFLEFHPQTGREQYGHRPAIVLSPKAYNQKTSLAVLCPITSRVKGYPFEVTVADVLPKQSVVLADQVKSLDWKQRKASFQAKAPSHIVEEVTAKVIALIAG